MLKFYAALLSVIGLLFLFTNNIVFALNNGIVISQVQVGDISSPRLIEIYNNTDEPIDITGWCLYHSSASDKTKTKLVCFEDANPAVHLLLRARSYALVGSSQLEIDVDLLLEKSLGGATGGHVYIIDNKDIEVDRFGWGSALAPELNSKIESDDNIDHIFERKQTVVGNYLDTDDNSLDFIDSVYRDKYLVNLIDEVVDVCSNVNDIQAMIPDGYYRSLYGDCLPNPVDVCSNIEGLQTIVPDGYRLDESGNCQIDICLNIDGLQLFLPDNMKLDDNGDCKLNLLKLQITELLPNVVGSDLGNEFIELFNHNAADVYLDDYILRIGVDDFKFPAGAFIKAGTYLKLSNDDINFTLVNTTSFISLMSVDLSLIDETFPYINPDDGMSWALINGIWQYTNQPTPGAENISSVIKVEPVVVIEKEVAPQPQPQPCASNQYRNPDTGRCRLLPVASSGLEPCKDGQYRSEETNRCRSIVADVVALTPCEEGQERNAETNRCRKIVIAAVLDDSELTPCKEGQERNPETNRCRNIISNIPVADYAPVQTEEPTNNYVGMWSLVGVGSVAVVYGIWEWRQEIVKLTRKLFAFLHLPK